MKDTHSLAVPYDTIPAKQVHWLWKGFIPFRHVTLVVGQGGSSKGISTIELAARMSRHDPAPGEPEPSCAAPMDVILIAPEDDPNESVRGRLEAAGAVLDRMHNLTTFPDGQPFTVPTDIPAIEQAISEIEYAKCDDGTLIPRLAADGEPHKVGMVILDPLLALASGNMTTRGQARPVMEALERVAKKHHLAILLTHHTNADGKAAGSRAIVETVRNVLTLARIPGNPEDSPVRSLTVTKTNIGVTGATQRYALCGPVEAPRIVWSCETPPADMSRGYDVAGPGMAEPGEGIPVIPDEPARYRATYLTGNDDPLVIDDFKTAEQARMACRAVAPADLEWHEIPTVPGMEGAAVTDHATGAVSYYGVLDRQAKAA